jgi:hypothetical protein
LTEPAGAAEPGSYRDPDSRVLVAEDAVYRVLSEEGLADWRALRESSLFAELSEEGLIVATDEDGADPLPRTLDKPQAGVLRHPRLPFVSYPYEWSFEMLRDAALLQLELLARAIDAGLMLKDASPYNVQFLGARPLFVDIGSFERLREGEPWVAYRQFCSLFLNPLLLQAYRGIDFQPWLRGSLEGISPSEADRLFSLRDHFRRGVFSHVHLHARLEQRHAARAGGEAKRELREANFKTELIRANVARLQKLVTRLDWSPPRSAWSGYRDENTYSEADDAAKRAFVQAVVATHGPASVWDLGANDGAYSRIAAAQADQVLAVDSDHATVDALYRRLRDARDEKVLPLVADLANPSPGLGWRGLERRALVDRGSPDLVLALALVHHLSIGANVPLREVVDWLRSLDAVVAVEFPTPEDPMVERLRSGKREGTHPDYALEHFERCLAEAFEISRREELPSKLRVLYELAPR